MQRRRVVVRGDVQGVFFRDGCRRAALAAGVRGWVRNCDDGSVEAVFEGEAPAVESLCDWCREGPPHARVDEVVVTAEGPIGERGFEVR
ncbi:MAG TPA: acylphosphatase [Nocardioidaceae bacterium]|nr:acylphosphatase [Nocardioidaceae bacterium]